MSVCDHTWSGWRARSALIDERNCLCGASEQRSKDEAADSHRVPTYHAKVRLYERYGLELSNKQWRDVRQDIEDGVALKVGKSANGEYWAVLFNGLVIELVYDRRRRKIVTVMEKTADVMSNPRKEKSQSKPWEFCG